MEIDDIYENNDGDELFKNAKGHPIEFSLSLSYEERNKVQRIVENFGGNLVGYRKGPNTIRLVPPGPVLNDRNEDLFRLQYIYDCVQHRELLDIKNYRVNESHYTSDVDVMEIVLGIRSWHDAKEKHKDSGEVVSDFEDDDYEPVGTAVKRSRMRRDYTFAERMAIVHYIIKHKRYSEVKGRSLWIDMEKAKVCPHRTWESMKEHFRKVIVHRIKEFDLDVSTAKKLCRLYLTQGEMKMEFGDSSVEEKEKRVNSVCSSARVSDVRSTRLGSVEEVDENSNNEIRGKRKSRGDTDHTESDDNNHSANQSTSDGASSGNTDTLLEDETQQFSVHLSPSTFKTSRDIHSRNENTLDDAANANTFLQSGGTQPFSVHLSQNTSEAAEEDCVEHSPVIPFLGIITSQKEVAAQDGVDSGKDVPLGVTNISEDIPTKGDDSSSKTITKTLPSVCSSEDIQEIPSHNSSSILENASSCFTQNPKGSGKAGEDRNNVITSSVESDYFYSCASHTSPERIQSGLHQNSDVEKDSDQEDLLSPLGIPVTIKEELIDVSDTETVLFASEEGCGIQQQRIRQNISDSGAELFSSDEEVGAGPDSALWRRERKDCRTKLSLLDEKSEFAHKRYCFTQKRDFEKQNDTCTKNVKFDLQYRRNDSEYNSDGSVSPDEVIIRRPRITRKLYAVGNECTARNQAQKVVVLLEKLDLEKYKKIYRNNICRYIVSDPRLSELKNSAQSSVRNKTSSSSGEDCSDQDCTDSDNDMEFQKTVPRKETGKKFSNNAQRKQVPIKMHCSDTEDSNGDLLADHIVKEPFKVPDSDSSIQSVYEDDPDYIKDSTKIRLPRQYRVYEDVAILNYIHRTKSHLRVGGVQLWKEMESKGIVKDRSWHSLKERYRKVLVKNLERYAKSGINRDVIRRFQKKIRIKMEPKDPTDMRRTYSMEEDLLILGFIMRTRRYSEVTAKNMWKLMSTTEPGLQGRTWQSLKERFRKVIVNNLDQYRIPENQKKKFKKTVGTIEKKSYIRRCPPKGHIRKYFSKKGVHSYDNSSSNKDENSEDSSDADKVHHKKDRGRRIKKFSIISYENEPLAMSPGKKKKLFSSKSSLFCDTPEVSPPNRIFFKTVKRMKPSSGTHDHSNTAGLSSTSVVKNLNFTVSTNECTEVQEESMMDENFVHPSQNSRGVQFPNRNAHLKPRVDNIYSVLEEPTDTEWTQEQEMVDITNNGAVQETISFQGEEKGNNRKERPSNGRETEESDVLVGSKRENMEISCIKRADISSVPQQEEKDDKHNCSEQEGKDENITSQKHVEEKDATTCLKASSQNCIEEKGENDTTVCIEHESPMDMTLSEQLVTVGTTTCTEASNYTICLEKRENDTTVCTKQRLTVDISHSDSEQGETVGTTICPKASNHTICLDEKRKNDATVCTEQGLMVDVTHSEQGKTVSTTICPETANSAICPIQEERKDSTTFLVQEMCMDSMAAKEEEMNSEKLLSDDLLNQSLPERNIANVSEKIVLLKQLSESTLIGHGEVEVGRATESECKSLSQSERSSMLVEKANDTNNDDSQQDDPQGGHGSIETCKNAVSQKESKEEHTASQDIAGAESDVEGNCIDNALDSLENLDLDDCKRVADNIMKKQEFEDHKKNKIPSEDTSRNSVPTSNCRDLKSPGLLHDIENIRKTRSMTFERILRKRKIRKVLLKGQRKYK